MRLSLIRILLLSCVTVVLLGTLSCTKSSHAQTFPAALQLEIKPPFRFVAYGDTRFHDPKDTDPANPAVRQALVQAIADANPAFVCFSGDIVLNGNDPNDWKVWDDETAIWREKKIPVYPALGNHDLHGKEAVALGNYFQRFPELKGSRYYSVQAANALILALDSLQDEVSGPQGEWLADRLDHVSANVDFVFLLLHHPPYTSSSDSAPGGGHSARAQESALAKILEGRAARAHYRIIVIAGHVHNYERFEHTGVTYFVSGGGGARPYLINRAPNDLFHGPRVNYHYLLLEVSDAAVKIIMNRIDFSDGKPSWTSPDVVTIAPRSKNAQGATP